MTLLENCSTFNNILTNNNMRKNNMLTNLALSQTNNIFVQENGTQYSPSITIVANLRVNIYSINRTQLTLGTIIFVNQKSWESRSE